jgi:hypothetical protein
MRKAVAALLCVAVTAVAWTSATTNARAQPANPSTAAPAVKPQGGANPALPPRVNYLTSERQKRERVQAIGQQHSQQLRQHPEWAKVRRSQQFRQHPEWRKVRRSHLFHQHPEWAKVRRSHLFHQHPEWAKSHKWWQLHHPHSGGKAHPKGRSTHGR